MDQPEGNLYAPYQVTSHKKLVALDTLLTYQVEAAEVLPKRDRAARDGAMSFSFSTRFFSISSSTPRPPEWSKKCSKHVLKLGTYFGSARTFACEHIQTTSFVCAYCLVIRSHIRSVLWIGQACMNVTQA